MGIYSQPIVKSNVTQNPDGSTTWTETQDDLSSICTRTVTATAWDEKRYACYCCTCDAHDVDGSYSSMSDDFCRNHGGSFGMRPCDIHNLPGSSIVDPETDVDTGVMPMAVRAYREAVKNGEPTG